MTSLLDPSTLCLLSSSHESGSSFTKIKTPLQLNSLDKFLDEVNTLYDEYREFWDAGEGDGRCDFYTWQIALNLTKRNIEDFDLGKLRDEIDLVVSQIEAFNEKTYNKNEEEKKDRGVPDRICPINKLVQKEDLEIYEKIDKKLKFLGVLESIISSLQYKFNEDMTAASQYFEKVQAFFRKLQSGYEKAKVYFSALVGPLNKDEFLVKKTAKKNYFEFIESSKKATCDFLYYREEGVQQEPYYKNSLAIFEASQEKTDRELVRSCSELEKSLRAYNDICDALKSDQCKPRLIKQADSFTDLNASMLTDVVETLHACQELRKHRHWSGFFSGGYPATFKTSVRQAQLRAMQLIREQKERLPPKLQIKLIALVGFQLGVSCLWTNSYRRMREAKEHMSGKQTYFRSCLARSSLFKKYFPQHSGPYRAAGWGVNGNKNKFRVPTAVRNLRDGDSSDHAHERCKSS